MKRAVSLAIALLFVVSLTAYLGCIADEPESPADKTVGVAVNTPPPDPSPQKVKLCHVPPGNPENAHVIIVSVRGVPAHIAHGDCFAPPGAERGDPCRCGGGGPDPECQGASCGNFTACNLPNNCLDPVCVTTYEGGGLCVEGATPCGGLLDCPNGTGDCPPGYICAVETCCGRPVCLPPEAFCPEGGGGAAYKMEIPVEYDGPRIGKLGVVHIERRR